MLGEMTKILFLFPAGLRLEVTSWYVVLINMAAVSEYRLLAC